MTHRIAAAYNIALWSRLAETSEIEHLDVSFVAPVYSSIYLPLDPRRSTLDAFNAGGGDGGGGAIKKFCFFATCNLPAPPAIITHIRYTLSEV